MTDINMTFNVTVHFGNGVSIEKGVPLKKAMTYITKENVIIPDGTEFVEINGVAERIVVPVNMTFVLPISPKFKHLDTVSRYMLYKRDNGKCGYCGRELTQKEATIDHILPRSRGGANEWENVVLSCKKCNSKKDSKTPEEAGMRLRVNPYNPKRKKK